MSSVNDLVVDAGKFNPRNVPDNATQVNKKLVEIGEKTPKWWEVGAARYREMRWNNETALPRPPVLDHGVNEEIPSRESGRSIAVRVFKPRKNKSSISGGGIILHIHGGGWVLSSHEYQDTYLDFQAESTGLPIVSVNYRLAPEHPYPAGSEDCYDVTEYLSSSAGLERFGGPIRFISGESAGGHLTVTTFLHLATKAIDGDTDSVQAVKNLKAIIPHYGAFQLSEWTPSVRSFKPSAEEGGPKGTLVLDQEIMDQFRDAFLPNTKSEQRLDPFISPLYADWAEIDAGLKKATGRGLPPALFTCGTRDLLLDDSIFMSAKWQMAAGDASLGRLIVFPGAPHGFTGLGAMGLKSAGDLLETYAAYMKEKLNG